MPPKLARLLVSRRLSARREEVLDDLALSFQQDLEAHGRWRASARYWREALNIGLLGIGETAERSSTSVAPMIYAHYLKIALRKAARQKGYAFINLFGLVVGLASFMVIMLYVYDEMSYDRFHADAERIHRVVYDEVGAGSEQRRIAAPGALKEAMLREIPEIEEATHLYPSYWGKALLSNETYTYYDDGFLYVDPSFFDVFSFDFIRGDARSAFADPASVVLTESVARRFFGDTDALGRTLTFNQHQPLTVTGVIEDVPAQSHLHFDFLTSTVAANRPQWETGWGQGHMHTYIKVKPQADLLAVDARIQRLIDTYHQAYLAGANLQATYFTQPLTDIHLSPPRLWEITPNGSKLYIKVLALIALFILLIAGINYVNLTTARSARRAREIGMRKVVGAYRKSLIYQFLSESILTVMVAGILAVLLTEAVLPFFNNLMQKQLSLLASAHQAVWGLLATAVLIFGLTAGLYPAFYLSAFRPLSILRKQGPSKRDAFSLRKTLVVTQFALAAFLIVGVIVVQEQMTYVRSADLGFDKDQVIVIKNFNLAPDRDRNYVVRPVLEALPGVVKVGAVNEMVGLQDNSSEMPIQVRGSDVQQSVLWTNVGYHYLETVGIELKEGRYFSPAFESTSSRDVVILNETAVRLLGIQEPVVGQQITDQYHPPRTIIGVVKDFHFTSLHNEIKPFVFGFTPNANTLAVKLSGGNTRETLAQIEETWKTFVPDVPLDFYFMDEKINQLYRAEQNFSTLFSIMTGLSLLIACLGLFGLVAFTAEQRTKEIGIRKVLGASVGSVVALLSKDFVTLVVLANLIAWPVAYLAMSKWLDNFAYHISVGLWTFALAGVSVLLIAVLTVSYQALKAATANPVKSLRYE